MGRGCGEVARWVGGGGEWCVYVCSPSLDQSLVNDAPEELSGDLQLLVRKLGEELVLIKHVLEHTSEHLLQREWHGDRVGVQVEGRVGERRRGPAWETGGGSHRYIHTL